MSEGDLAEAIKLTTIADAFAAIEDGIAKGAAKHSNPSFRRIAGEALDRMKEETGLNGSSTSPEDFKAFLKALPDYFTTPFRDDQIPEFCTKYSISALNAPAKAIAKKAGVAESVDAAAVAANKGGTTFGSLKDGEKFRFQKDGKEVLVKKGTSYTNEAGKKFKTSANSTVFLVSEGVDEGTPASAEMKDSISGRDYTGKRRTYKKGDKVLVHSDSSEGEYTDTVRKGFIQNDTTGDTYPAVVLTKHSWAALSDIEPATEESIDEAAGQAAILAALKGREGKEVELADVAKHPSARGVHFKALQSAAKALKKSGKCDYDGISKITLKEGEIDQWIGKDKKRGEAYQAVYGILSKLRSKTSGKGTIDVDALAKEAGLDKDYVMDVLFAMDRETVLKGDKVRLRDWNESIDEGSEDKVFLIKKALAVLRKEDKAAYDKLANEWRDSLPHTGKDDILQGPKFDKWLEDQDDSELQSFYKDLKRIQWEAVDDEEEEALVEAGNIDALVKYWKKKLPAQEHPWEYLHKWALKHPEAIKGDPKGWATWMYHEVFGEYPATAAKRKRDAEKGGKLAASDDHEDHLTEALKWIKPEDKDAYNQFVAKVNAFRKEAGKPALKKDSEDLQGMFNTNYDPKVAAKQFKEDADEVTEADVEEAMTALPEGMEVAQTIAKQLGKGALFMMGAKNLVGSDKDLAMKIGRNKTSGNALRIELQPNDLYTVRLYRATINGLKDIEVKKDISVDQLHSTISAMTGLALSVPKVIGINAESVLTCKKNDVQGFIKALRACGAADTASVVIEGEDVKITVPADVAERVKALMG